MAYLIGLNRYRDLLWLWTVREVQVRYKQSLLGVGWAILQPLALTLMFTFVFSVLIQMDTGDVPYPVFVYSALVPWTFFTTSLSFGIPSLVNNMNLVTKIYFPREILPLASIGAAFVDLIASGVVLAGMLLFYRVWPGALLVWIVPLLILQIVLTIGVTLLGAMIIVFFRDMRFVIPLATQVWMYASPILYPADMIPDHLWFYYYLNPMAGIVDGYRRVLVLGEPPQSMAILLGTFVSIVTLALGYALFKRAEPVFADLI
ncbi:MAG: ABC transporter permease [Anaerolineae bacterium]|nr:ABC transporter permease [Anaerolineae bacterium]